MITFVAANSAFLYYLFVVVPTITTYRPDLVSNIAIGILALGASQVVQFVTGWGAAPTGKFNVGPLSLGAGLPVLPLPGRPAPPTRGRQPPPALERARFPSLTPRSAPPRWRWDF